MTTMTPFMFCLTQQCGLITPRLHAIAAPTSAPLRRQMRGDQRALYGSSPDFLIELNRKTKAGQPR